MEIPLKAMGRRFTVCPTCLLALGVDAGETLQEGRPPSCGVCPIVNEARCCAVCDQRQKCIEANNQMCAAHPPFCDFRLQIVDGSQLREEEEPLGKGS